MQKKYKYLSYIPAPVDLKADNYDLVHDQEFLRPDGRIPLLMVTQFGVFPAENTYEGKMGYTQLKIFKNQTVGLIRRAYLSNREYSGIIELALDAKTLERIEHNHLKIDFSLWDKSNQLA